MRYHSIQDSTGATKRLAVPDAKLTRGCSNQASEADSKNSNPKSNLKSPSRTRAQKPKQDPLS